MRKSHQWWWVSLRVRNFEIVELNEKWSLYSSFKNILIKKRFFFSSGVNWALTLPNVLKKRLKLAAWVQTISNLFPDDDACIFRHGNTHTHTHRYTLGNGLSMRGDLLDYNLFIPCTLSYWMNRIQSTFSKFQILQSLIWIDK